MEDPGPFFSQPHSLPFHHLEMSFSKDAFRKAIVAFRQRFLNETTFYIPPSQSRDGYRKPTPGSVITYSFPLPFCVHPLGRCLRREE